MTDQLSPFENPVNPRVAQFQRVFRAWEWKTRLILFRILPLLNLPTESPSLYHSANTPVANPSCQHACVMHQSQMSISKGSRWVTRGIMTPEMLII
jgi:nitric oxide synthase oxygenase domain/subunit